VVALGGAPYTFDKTYNHFDWKAGVEQDLAPSVMVYGVVQTGFQAGTFNALPNTPTYSNEVKPESYAPIRSASSRAGSMNGCRSTTSSTTTTSTT